MTIMIQDGRALSAYANDGPPKHTVPAPPAPYTQEEKQKDVEAVRYFFTRARVTLLGVEDASAAFERLVGGAQ